MDASTLASSASAHTAPAVVYQSCVPIQARLVDPEHLYEEVSDLRRRHAEAQTFCDLAERSLQQARKGEARQKLPAALRRAESLRSHSASEEAASSCDDRREACLLAQLDELHSRPGAASSQILEELQGIEERRQRSEYLFHRLQEAEAAVTDLQASVDVEGLSVLTTEADLKGNEACLADLRAKLSKVQSQLSAFKSAEAAAVKADLLAHVDLEDGVSSWHDFSGGLRVRAVLAVGERTWPLEAAALLAQLALGNAAGRSILEVDGVPGLVMLTRSVAMSIASPPRLPVVSPIEVLREVLGQFGDKLRLSQRLVDVVHGPSGICRLKDTALPKCFKGSLRKYQMEGFRWLASNHANGFGCLLADDMGLGKTIQTICLLCHLQEQGLMSGPALVIVPTSLLQNWQRELRTWAPALRVYEYVGVARVWPTAADVVLTTYGIVRTSVGGGARGGGSVARRGVKHSRNRPAPAPLRNLGQIGALILDEAQRIKNHGSEVSRACKHVAAGCLGMKVALSGTPVENRLDEIHSIFEVVLPAYLGTVAQFKQSFTFKNRDVDAANLAKLRKVLDPFMLRRLKTDPSICPELPPKVDMRHDVTLTEKQERLYNVVLDHFMALIAKSPKRTRGSQIFAMVHSLRKVCNHPATYKKPPDVVGFSEPITEAAEEAGKTVALLALLKELLQQGEKCLVFTQYLSTIKLLRSLVFDAFGTRTVAFTGELSARQRVETVQNFQTEPGCRVCFATLGAGGVGLNLTAASHVVHFDRCWNPAVEDQGSDRCHRIGQKSTVIVHRLICQDTFEERVDAILKAKQRLRDACSEGGEATWLADYTDQDLRDMFALGATGGKAGAGSASSSTVGRPRGRPLARGLESGQKRLFEKPQEKSLQPEVVVPASRPLLQRLCKGEFAGHVPPPVEPSSWQLLHDAVPPDPQVPRSLHAPVASCRPLGAPQQHEYVGSSFDFSIHSELLRHELSKKSDPLKPMRAPSTSGNLIRVPQRCEDIDSSAESPIRSSPRRSSRMAEELKLRSSLVAEVISMAAPNVDVGRESSADDDIMVVSSDDDFCQAETSNSRPARLAGGSPAARRTLGPFAKRQRLSLPGSFGGC